ncbi:hypothetical protein BLA6993_00800 [Burkholderia lata]|nr:hypothetical protein BLA6993_00800 [Burkholderia lata]
MSACLASVERADAGVATSTHRMQCFAGVAPMTKVCPGAGAVQ